MKRLPTALILIVLFAVTVPAIAKENRSGAGIGYTAGNLSVDIAGTDDLDFTGYTIFWKQGFNDLWGLLVSYRDMKDDENLPPGDEINYTQWGVHAVVQWRHGKRVRPFVKFGMAKTDLEVTDTSMGTQSEEETAFSFGGGLEAGTERIAFYADYDFTRAELSSIDFDFGDLVLGIIFKY